MSEEADYRDMKQAEADRAKHLEDLRDASRRREEMIAQRVHNIDQTRKYLAREEAALAEQRRQLELDAETIGILERYHANRARANEALSDKPFHKPVREIINELRLGHMHAAGRAGARVSDAQHDGTPDELVEAWVEYCTHTELGNDMGRLMTLMGYPRVALVDIDTTYPADAPAAGSLGPRRPADVQTEGTDQ